MTRKTRIALTQTRNAYRSMPESRAQLHELEGRLEELREANLDHHVRLIELAAAAGAHIVGLGELFTGPYFALEEDPMWFGLAEDRKTGPTVTRLRECARRSGVAIVAPIYELVASSGRRFNTALLVERSGELLGFYRKAHIPAGDNETASFHETFYYEASDGEPQETAANISSNPYFPVFETSAGRVGVAICYDRHFPGVMQSLAREGAEIVFSPAVTFGRHSRRMWMLEFGVDAARESLFIAGSNRMGSEEPWGVEYFGESTIVGPLGHLPKIEVHPELVVADVELDGLREGTGSGWDLPRDQRPEIYTPRPR